METQPAQFIDTQGKLMTIMQPVEMLTGSYRHPEQGEVFYAPKGFNTNASGSARFNDAV